MHPHINHLNLRVLSHHNQRYQIKQPAPCSCAAGPVESAVAIALMNKLDIHLLLLDNVLGTNLKYRISYIIIHEKWTDISYPEIFCGNTRAMNIIIKYKWHFTIISVRFS